MKTVLGLLSAFMLLPAASAGIPEPPAVLYGQVVLDGQQIHGNDDVTVMARVDGVPQPIGRYDMGVSAAAGDDYVLKLRIESPFDGQAQSDDAARVGQTANLYVRVAEGPERPAGQFDILGSGIIENRDLNVETTFGKCGDEDDDIDLVDFAVFVTCITDVNGAVGLECGCADFDDDRDCDLVDWAAFQNAFTSVAAKGTGFHQLLRRIPDRTSWKGSRPPEHTQEKH